VARLIVHATDFSAGADAAFRHALAAAKRDRAQLALVHVLEPVTFGDEEYMLRELEHRDAAAAAAGKGFDRLLAAAKRARVKARSVLLDGNASGQIVQFARKRHASLITIGTHGRTGLRRLFLGSVAAGVVGAAPCPVLTVRMAAPARRPRGRRARSAR
jgi:nucleotide-binding universal stress UspA family protein